VAEGEVARGHAHPRFDDQGRLADPEISEQVGAVMTALLEEAEQRTALAA
jgi:hypothetical protein